MNNSSEPLVCLTVAERTVASVLEKLAGNREYIDLAEIRADYLDDGEMRRLADLPRLTGVPLLFTIRRRSDGGRWDKPENERKPLLLRAAASGFSYLDLESDVSFSDVQALCRESGTTIIRSLHDFSRLPGNFAAVVKNLPRAPGEIAKAAVSPNSTRELIEMVKACGELKLQKKIILGMGPWGFPTRVLSGKLGSYLTFCSPLGLETAPGHIDPETLVKTYRFKSITSATGVYCIIANPVMHSRSPWIHNPGLEAAGIDGVYIPIQVDDPALLFELAPLLDIKGASVSVPHKTAVRRYLAFEEESVRAVGSCNTVYLGSEGFHGANTDVPGFSASLVELIGDRKLIDGMCATVIGAGGAARAVIYALKLLGARICVINRTPEKAETLAGEFGCSWAALHSDSLPVIKDHRGLIVQTTSAGMYPQEDKDPLPFYRFSGDEIVYDLVYAPAETVFLRRAKVAGCKTQNGERMLLEQAYLQFKLFTGLDYPEECRG